MNTPLTWLLDEKSDEAQLNDLRPAIESIGDHYITMSRQEAQKYQRLIADIFV